MLLLKHNFQSSDLAWSLIFVCVVLAEDSWYKASFANNVECCFLVSTAIYVPMLVTGELCGGLQQAELVFVSLTKK